MGYSPSCPAAGILTADTMRRHPVTAATTPSYPDRRHRLWVYGLLALGGAAVGRPAVAAEPQAEETPAAEDGSAPAGDVPAELSSEGEPAASSPPTEPTSAPDSLPPVEVTPWELRGDYRGPHGSLRATFEFEGLIGLLRPPSMFPDPPAIFERRPSGTDDLLIGDGEDWRSALAPPGGETATQSLPEPPDPSAGDGE